MYLTKFHAPDSGGRVL